MHKPILTYAFLTAALVVLLKLVEYHFWVKQLSIEIYIGITAILFTAIGVWFGVKGFRNKKETVTSTPPIKFSTSIDLDITERETEVLEGIAEGLSNREIAEKLFLSENTVKTHAQKLFDKLEVKRRTQAVQKARALSILK
ncbi:MAG: LuxR C-terminal-related transcriptional regulator [Vicingaceae bacterium]